MRRSWTQLALFALVMLGIAVPLMAGDFDDAKRAYRQAMADPNSTSRDKVDAVLAFGDFTEGRDCKKAAGMLFDILEEDPDHGVPQLRAMQAQIVEKRRKLWEGIMRTGMISQSQQQQLANYDREIDDYEDQIRSRSLIKNAAVEALAEMDSADGHEQLIDGIGERKWRIVVGSIEAARLMRWSGAFDAVAEHYPSDGEDPNREAMVRMATIRCLAELDASRAAPNVIAALSDENLLVRSQAVSATRLARVPECIPALIARLGQRDRDGEWEDVEQGKIRWDVVRALRDLTGVDKGEDASQWQIWWNSNRQGFRCPPPSADEADTPRVDNPGGDDEQRTGIEFYGIPVETNMPIFVIDRSGSMQSAADLDVAQQQINDYLRQNPGATAIPPLPPPPGSRSKWEAVQDELFETLDKLDEEAHFGLVWYSTDVTMYGQGAMVEASERNIERAQREVRAQTASGLTNIYDAFKAAFTMAQGGGAPGSIFTDGDMDLRADTIFFLTDGAPTTGPSINGVAPTDPPNRMYTGLLEQQINQWNATLKLRIHCICVGNGDVDFMRALAAANDGNFKHITKD